MQKPIATSKEVINYLKDNLKKENIASVFIGGSLPEKLIPESDLDIFIIWKKREERLWFE